MEENLAQQPSNCIKIVLFGPESTGKTTLAKQLAAHFNTRWVPEYMREYAQQKWDAERQVLERKDLLPIAEGQIKEENKAAKKATNFLFCDTNVLEIKVYSEYYFDGFCPAEIVKASKVNTYHHYFLTDIDVPWTADDLRDRPNDRSQLFHIFESELISKNLPFTVLSGNEKSRLRKAISILKEKFDI